MCLARGLGLVEIPVPVDLSPGFVHPCVMWVESWRLDLADGEAVVQRVPLGTLCRFSRHAEQARVAQ